MNYSDVKLDQVFVEAKDPTKPKRIQRRVQVIELRPYTAIVRVIEGRETGYALVFTLKRITDPKQWTLEPLKAAT